MKRHTFIAVVVVSLVMLVVYSSTTCESFVTGCTPNGTRPGRPSSDNSLRLYTKDECDSLNGKWYSNGECIKKEGGSYSAECRVLNTSVPSLPIQTPPPIVPSLPPPQPQAKPQVQPQPQPQFVQKPQMPQVPQVPQMPAQSASLPSVGDHPGTFRPVTLRPRNSAWSPQVINIFPPSAYDLNRGPDGIDGTDFTGSVNTPFVSLNLMV